jgi:hypothetical protein
VLYSRSSAEAFHGVPLPDSEVPEDTSIPCHIAGTFHPSFNIPFPTSFLSPQSNHIIQGLKSSLEVTDLSSFENSPRSHPCLLIGIAGGVLASKNWRSTFCGQKAGGDTSLNVVKKPRRGTPLRRQEATKEAILCEEEAPRKAPAMCRPKATEEVTPFVEKKQPEAALFVDKKQPRGGPASGAGSNGSNRANRAGLQPNNPLGLPILVGLAH